MDQPTPAMSTPNSTARQLKRDEREASRRWCPSCYAIVFTEWGECVGHQTKGKTDAPYFGCHAVLIKGPAPQSMEHVKFPVPTGSISHATLIQILNNSGLRPRYQKVNVVSAATPFGKREEVPHNTECPLCKSAQAYGLYITSYTSGNKQIELACAQCATSKIPFRRDMEGVVCVKHCRLWATIECVGQDAWKLEVV